MVVEEIYLQCCSFFLHWGKKDIYELFYQLYGTSLVKPAYTADCSFGCRENWNRVSHKGHDLLPIFFRIYSESLHFFAIGTWSK